MAASPAPPSPSPSTSPPAALTPESAAVSTSASASSLSVSASVARSATGPAATLPAPAPAAAQAPVSAPNPAVKKACDNCRLRKTRCDLASPCTNCASRGFECTYATPHRKRGPAGRRLNEIRQREQQRSRAGVSGSSAACLSSSAADPAPSSTASEAGRHAAAGPNTTPHAVPLPQTHASHHRPQEQQQFIFMREGDDLAVAATEEILGPGASWEGLLNSFSVSPGPLAAQPPGPSSPSVQGTGSTPSAAFDDAVFSLSNIPQHGSYSHSHGSAGNSRSLQAAPGAITSPPAPSSLNHLNGHGMWPSAVTDENLIRWLDIYFERLYPTLPILKRSTVFARLLSREHHTNPDFGAMLLSLSAFALIQPVRVSEQQSSSLSRDQVVNLLLSVAVKMRTIVSFGQSPTLDMIFTSIFLFACLFQKGQHNAAWLRLREAVELGSLFGLDQLDNYADCGPEQKQQRLRVYYLLAVTERAYGIERHHSVGFLGHPSAETRGILESVPGVADSIDASGIVIHDDVEATCMLGLVQLIRLFDAIDEDFLRCWNGQCKNDRGGCRFLSEATAIRIFEQISRYDPLPASSRVAAGASPVSTRSHGRRQALGTSPVADLSGLSHTARPRARTFSQTTHDGDEGVPVWLSTATLTPAQEADLLVNQQWLQNRLWHLCLSHKLLVPRSEHPALCIYNAITVAENTLEVCRYVPLSSIEVHGVGLIEKLYCIVESAVAAIRHSEAAGDWWGEDEQMSGTAGTQPSGRHGYGEEAGGEGGGTNRSAGGGGSSHIQRHRPLLLGFLELFKTIRAGEHAFLGMYSALVGQDLGLQ